MIELNKEHWMRKTLKYLAKHKDVSHIRAELARAHIMIALLALVIIGLLSLGNAQSLSFDPMLSGIAVGLLVIVAILSIGVTFAVTRKSK